MTIQLKFDEVHDNILWQIFPKDWEWEDYLTSTAELAEMIREKGGTIHLIIDLQNSKIPKSGTAFQYSRQGVKLYPENIGEIVLITNVMLISTIVSSIRRIIRASIITKVHTADNADQAYDILVGETSS